jgi:MtN3 and saliva related transmembrane protein
MHIETLGYIGAFLTTAAFFPQTIKTIKSRDTAAISLAMYVMFTTGIGFWLGYGLMIESLPLIFANTITFVLSAIILVLKLKEKPQTTLK